MSAPSEFAAIGLRGTFRKVGPAEYHGPCPFCGGIDRFAVFTDKAFPHWNGFCRKCGWKGWADEINPTLRQVTPEQRARYEFEAQQARRDRQARRVQTIVQFSNRRLWCELHEHMSAENRAWWQKQGIPPDWQDFWQLGFTTSAPVPASGSGAWAYSIPYFRFGFEIENMQYRLVAPPNPNDKYRWAGLGFSSFFTARPDLGATDETIICEGAKKAMVATCRRPGDIQIFAVPSKSDFASIETAIPGGRVWVILDPDAYDRACELARKFADAVVVRLPCKLDDALNAGANWSDIEGAMRFARRQR